MGRDTLTAMFADARRGGRAVLLPFMTAGLPDPQSSVALFEAMAEAGADGFEVGIPYTDPLMDGPVIQRGSEMAIEAGTTPDRALGIVEDVKATTGRPVLVMTYANPILHRGVDEFTAAAAAAGADGLIVADMPVEETGPLRRAAERHGLGVVQFVAPTSSRRRIEAVAAAEPCFIYAVAEMGVTGERRAASSRLAELVERIRAVTDVPVVAGVGISTPEQAAAAASIADGVIVGSALVRRVLEASDPTEAASVLGRTVSALAAALS